MLIWLCNQVRNKFNGKIYVVAESRLAELPVEKAKKVAPNGPAADTQIPNSKTKPSGGKSQNVETYEVLDKFPGSSLVGKKWAIFIFNFVTSYAAKRFFLVIYNMVASILSGSWWKWTPHLYILIWGSLDLHVFYLVYYFIPDQLMLHIVSKSFIGNLSQFFVLFCLCWTCLMILSATTWIIRTISLKDQSLTLASTLKFDRLLTLRMYLVLIICVTSRCDFTPLYLLLQGCLLWVWSQVFFFFCL